MIWFLLRPFARLTPLNLRLGGSGSGEKSDRVVIQLNRVGGKFDGAVRTPRPTFLFWNGNCPSTYRPQHYLDFLPLPRGL
jgi:hypothetical protein